MTTRGVYTMYYKAILIVFLYFWLKAVAEDVEWIENHQSHKSYKLVYYGQNWFTARRYCETESAKLAFPSSKDDFMFMQKMVRAMSYDNVTNSDNPVLVWLGINNLGHYKTWVTVDHTNLEDTGFNTWVEGNGESISDDPKEPHCAGLGPVHFGLMNYWCHKQLPYLCQRTI